MLVVTKRNKSCDKETIMRIDAKMDKDLPLVVCSCVVDVYDCALLAESFLVVMRDKNTMLWWTARPPSWVAERMRVVEDLLVLEYKKRRVGTVE